MSAYYPNEPPRRGWWSRNWKWVVPVGCLTPLLCCGGAVTLFVTLIFGALKSSGAYTEALARARADPRVKKALGEPIEPGFWVNGKVSAGGGGESADLAIPVSGPKGAGTLYAVGHNAGGGWQFSTLEVAVEGAPDRINLLAPKEAPPR
jgi:hypothetical protein